MKVTIKLFYSHYKSLLLDIRESRTPNKIKRNYREDYSLIHLSQKKHYSQPLWHVTPEWSLHAVTRKSRADRYPLPIQTKVPRTVLSWYVTPVHIILHIMLHTAHICMRYTRRTINETAMTGVTGTQRRGSSIKPFYSWHSHIHYKVTALSEMLLR